MYADQVTLTLLPQEQEGHCKFTCLRRSRRGRQAVQFVATRNALEKFGWEVIVAALKLVQEQVAQKGGMDYLQVLEINGERLWIIDDGDVVTSLLPDDY
ncbi:MAG: hypothetical protein FJ272_17735 [Planctomycetes bacterium]|nr:hypothetical protein [Planctomycetota bacterium]